MTIINVPVTKGKGTQEVETEKLPDAVYAEALLQGLKVIMNRGMSKITKTTYPDAEEMKAAAMAQSEKNLEAIYSGDIKLTGVAKAKKVSGVVMTEARRLARNLVKDVLKKEGHKISEISAKSITEAANDYLASEDGAELLAQAQANIEERSKKTIKIDLTKIKKDESKVKAAEAKKAKAKAPAGAVMARGRTTSHRPGAGPANS